MSTADERQASFELAYRTLTSVWPSGWSLADLQQHLGGIPAERIRLVPSPGYATEQDLVEMAEQEDRLYELEDGVLVEKPMGWQEAILATLLSAEIAVYLKSHDQPFPHAFLHSILRVCVEWESALGRNCKLRKHGGQRCCRRRLSIGSKRNALFV